MEEFKEHKKDVRDMPILSPDTATEYAKRAKNLLDNLGASQYLIFVGFGPQGESNKESGNIQIGSATENFIMQTASNLSKQAMEIMMKSEGGPAGLLDALKKSFEESQGEGPQGQPKRNKKNPL